MSRMPGAGMLAAGALMLGGGCFIDELPAYDDDGSGMGGDAPALRSIVIGDATTCAVLETGAVRCWGSVPVGLGGSGGQTLRPVAVAALTDVESMYLGTDHGCVEIDGQLSCFGANDQGQLGTGQSGGSDLPVGPVVGLPSVAQASLSGSRSAAVTDDGQMLMWGAGIVAGFGNPQPTPAPGDLTGITAIAGYSDHDCAIVAGEVFCWGWNRTGSSGAHRSGSR